MGAMGCLQFGGVLVGIKRVATKVATYKIKVATSRYDKLQNVTTGISLKALCCNRLDTTSYET